jgi:hypothetical protein
MTRDQNTQADKLKQSAGELEDDDQARWEERLRRVARTKDAPAPAPRNPLAAKLNRKR